MDIANLTTYGCFGDGAMYKLNKSADLSKVQRYVKFEDIVEASLNSPASPVQQLQAVIAELMYVESVVAKHGIVAGSKCHEMLSRSIQQLTAVQ